MAMESLENLVQEWLRLDRNPATRAEIEELWTQGETVELEKRMRQRIEFGTAGRLRGRMQAGWSRMNDLIIVQASQGLCQYVLKNVENAHSRGVVIGYDHRYNSERWSQLTAAAFLANKMKVYLHRGLVHTPMQVLVHYSFCSISRVPFTVRRLDAACGVMITASHNPKDDNGYKVYWENAVQIIGPHDQGISESIKANLEPKTWSLDEFQSSSLLCDKTEEMKDAYFASLESLNLSHDLNAASSIKFVNTSMHGVSDPFIERAFNLFGFDSLSILVRVQEQQQPDPDFPTVAFPNPEEKGSSHTLSNLALQTADRVGASMVLAQDPDSDRFTAAEKSDYRGETWFNFTGDQLGCLFAARMLEIYKSSGKPLSQLAMVASTVSSKMVEKMAEVEGFKFVECLTGFKFIGNTSLSLVQDGYEVPFGYEEAIGYQFGSAIRDKDGVAATMVFAEMVIALRSRKLTVQDYLSELYARYGYFETNNSYFICNESSKIDSIFHRIRHYSGLDSKVGPDYPTEIAGFTVTSVVDLTAGNGYDSTNAPSYKPQLPFSSGHMIQFRAKNSDGLSIVLTTRTSGTEPKIKYYVDGRGDNDKRETLGVKLTRVVEELGCIWFEADKHHLGRPSN
ncbi:hypothetical protein C8J56DRAFT_791746 [Mycena floridula]|nr:hypothetical protein C8J56DRAFT_791746 [Mycena floridula]